MLLSRCSDPLLLVSEAERGFLAAVGAVRDVSGGSAAGVLQGQLGTALPSLPLDTCQKFHRILKISACPRDVSYPDPRLSAFCGCLVLSAAGNAARVALIFDPYP